MKYIPIKDEVIVPLLKVENSWALKEEDGITSITFYKGDILSVEKDLKNRFKEIVQLNPWLAGKLVEDKHQEIMHLVYPLAPISDDIFNELVQQNTEAVVVGSEMPYEKIAAVTKTAVVNKGSKMANKDERVSLLTIVPDASCPNDGFAIIFSLSHIAADGFTYYTIFNALFNQKAIPVLKVERDHKAGDMVVERVGKEEYNFIFSVPLIFNVIKGLLFGRKTRCYAFQINRESIESIKSDYTVQKNKEQTSTSQQEHISTNDILTSSFGRLVKARLLFMAINFRSRIAGIDESNAGNYDAALLFDDGKFAEPLGIRKTILNAPPYRTRSRSFPGIIESMFCRLGLITNWASFTGDLEMTGCEQKLHMPVYDPKTFPFDCAIVFAPMPNDIAVMYFAKTFNKEEAKKVLENANPVCEHIF